MSDPGLEGLEARLCADPDDRETFAVYADALIASGDVRGRLAGLQRARAAADTEALARQEAELWAVHGPELLGLLGDPSPQPDAHDRQDRDDPSGIPGYDLDWIEGHVRSVVIHEPYAADPGPGEVLADLLARPVARFLREVVIEQTRGFACDRVTGEAFRRAQARGPDVVAALAAAPRPALRRFACGLQDIPFSAEGDDDARDLLSHVGESLGDLTELWRAAPALREVLLSGGWFGLGALELPELRHLEVRQSMIHGTNLQAMIEARLPLLESLVVWLGAGDYGELSYSIGDLAALCDPARFPSLRHLGLVCSADTDAVVAMLARSPLLPQLTSLDLRGGVLEDTDGLVEQRERLGHLTRIDLRWNVFDLPATAVVEALPSALVDPQRWDGHQDVPRFNSCME